jgi:hypothetical protein
MVNRLLVVALLLCSGGPALAQSQDEMALARRLANEADRKNAISFVAASKTRTVPLLLSLTKMSVPGVDEHDLQVGLADAFGALKIREAIPFLLLNIDLRRWKYVDLKPWIKTAEAIEYQCPAVAALISIGPDSSIAAMRASDQAMTPEDHLAIVFVVSRIRGVPEAKPFLSAIIGHADIERSFAEEGIENVIK